MKILFVVPSVTNCGPVRVVQQLTSALTQRGLDCTVWYFDDLANSLNFDCPTRKIGFWGHPDLSGFDIIHSHGIRPDAWVYKLQVLGMHKASVSTIHNYVEKDLRYQYGWILSKIFTRAWVHIWHRQTGLVVLTRDAAYYYSKWLKGKRIRVIGNGIIRPTIGTLDKIDIEPIQELAEHHIILGACAAVTTRKGLEQIIYALGRNVDCAFVLIGDGDALRSLKQLALSLNVEDRCLFYGFRQNACDFLPHFDCVVMPSRSEGYPIALLEAAAVGRPVIVSDLPVFREMASTEDVLFSSLDDSESLDNAIREAQKRASQLSANVHSLYEREFTADRMADRYLRFYMELNHETNR